MEDHNIVLVDAVILVYVVVHGAEHDYDFVFDITVRKVVPSNNTQK